jgi:osmotically-inducible protein OsmY
VDKDNRLAAAVREALRSYEPLRLSRSIIEIGSRDGVIELSGIVRSAAMKPIAEQIARSVPGVKAVSNHLHTDAEIEAEAARALAEDPRTRLTTDRIVLRSTLGTCYLSGRVTNPEIRAAAEAIVRNVKGVQAVVNTLNAA